MMKKLLLIALALGLALFVYAAVGPYLTIRHIEKAIATQDMPLLTEQIDFPAVRESLKIQLNQTIERQTPELIKKIPFAHDLVSTLGSKILEQAIDPLMAGQLLYIMQGNKPAIDFGMRELISPVPESTSTQKVFENATYRYIDSQTFSATVDYADSGQYRFIFKRYGLHWKLCDIQLPFLQAPP
jgi:hypothetical protein